MSSHTDVQLMVDGEIASDHATVTVSGGHASAYAIVDGKATKLGDLRIKSTHDYGEVSLMMHGWTRSGLETTWSIRHKPRKPCNCGKNKNGGGR